MNAFQKHKSYKAKTLQIFLIIAIFLCSEVIKRMI